MRRRGIERWRCPGDRHLTADVPITGVPAMAGTESRHRRLVTGGGPVVTGLLSVGDAWAATNPMFGLGMSVGVVQAVSDAWLVLIGEASRGTYEYYAWRDRLTRRLVVEKGFSFVAVEGDWPDCRRLAPVLRRRPPGEPGRPGPGPARL